MGISMENDVQPDVTKQVQILSFSSLFIPMSSLMKFQKDAVSLRNI